MARLPVDRILGELVAINSVNPLLSADGVGEANVAAWITRFCDNHGLAHSLQIVAKDRPNVLAWVPGCDEEIRLLFVAHMDTVPVDGWILNPFLLQRDESRLYGRGCCDTKGSLAAMLHALATIAHDKPRATVIVVGTVDEEHHKAGAKALASSGRRYEAAVVGEPTSLELVVAHKGSVRWQIETLGRAAHTSKPQLGVNAITAMAKVIAAIDKAAVELAERAHPLVGSPTLTISLIEGGENLCNVPRRCAISIDRRLVPGETAAAALAEVERILQSMRDGDPALSVQSILPAAEDPPFEAPLDARIVEVASRACREVAGTSARKGVPYGTDASQLAPDITCVVLGPGNIDQAHTIDEFVELPELEKAAEIYRRIMLSY
jgi:acetylornithine deacetylase